jgi:hypothetical protein
MVKYTDHLSKLTFERHWYLTKEHKMKILSRSAIKKIAVSSILMTLSLHLGAVQSEEKEQENARINQQILDKQQEDRIQEQKRLDEQQQQRRVDVRIQQRKNDDASWERSHGR